MSYAEQEWAMAQASIRFQEHIDQGMEIYGPLAYENPPYPSLARPAEEARPPVPIGYSEGRRRQGGFRRDEDWRLSEEQDDAYEYLLETLSPQQRDALLVLAQKSPKQGLSQLVTALHQEWKRERRS